MNKISLMYKYSGGTDYRHTCSECKNCVKVGKGNRAVYKCLVYGNTNSAASDWKISYIACKHYNLQVPERPVIKLISREILEDNLEGQMSLFDMPEVTP